MTHRRHHHSWVYVNVASVNNVRVPHFWVLGGRSWLFLFVCCCWCVCVCVLNIQRCYRRLKLTPHRLFCCTNRSKGARCLRSADDVTLAELFLERCLKKSWLLFVLFFLYPFQDSYFYSKLSACLISLFWSLVVNTITDFGKLHRDHTDIFYILHLTDTQTKYGLMTSAALAMLIFIMVININEESKKIWNFSCIQDMLCHSIYNVVYIRFTWYMLRVSDG